MLQNPCQEEEEDQITEHTVKTKDNQASQQMLGITRIIRVIYQHGLEVEMTTDPELTLPYRLLSPLTMRTFETLGGPLPLLKMLLVEWKGLERREIVWAIMVWVVLME